MLPMKRLVAVGVAVATIAAYAILQPCPANAEDESAVLGDLAISQIAATPARAGETTVITFAVENAGTDRVLITGLQMPGEQPARIMGSFGQGHSGEIGTLPVRPGATERLDGRRIWIEVGPLARDLEPDSAIPADLVLGPYESPLTLHVGPVATGSTRNTNADARIANQSSPTTHPGAGC
ncbi:hypothetical protein [Microvirga sp. VF16]|uniref:hypothetical protein n=1 Tax=Microvirga sp. VF16 TaxID=2807101 RepID=UPI00193E961E|nr:hypothetical protein [Microvirga sp. VF16]QRM34649.1 hypothetical protein JO965_40890 [Microvirga sp. VF16]